MEPDAVVISYGGGLDSYVMLLLAIEHGWRVDAVVFCDVADGTLERDGEDPGEWPATYRHVREVVAPLCARNGIRFEWLDTARYPIRDARSLFQWMWDRNNIPIAGPGRTCTPIAKVERFERWMNDTYPGKLVEVWVGFEAGEEGRAATDPNAGKKRKKHDPRDTRRVNRFPLIEHGFCRCRCESFCRDRGLAIPRKSACVYCGYATAGDYKTLHRDLPATFERVAQLEERKPPTADGFKLSIKDFRKHKDASGKVVRYTARSLRVLVEKPYRPRRIPCKVCGAEQRATKAAGCDYLESARAA